MLFFYFYVKHWTVAFQLFSMSLFFFSFSRFCEMLQIFHRFLFYSFFFSVPHMFYVFFFISTQFLSASMMFFCFFFFFFLISSVFFFFCFFFVLWNASDFLLVGFHFSIFMSDVNVHEKGDCWKKQLIFNKLLQVSCLHEIQRLYAYLSLGSLKVVLLTQKFRNFSMNFIVMLWTSQP